MDVAVVPVALKWTADPVIAGNRLKPPSQNVFAVYLYRDPTDQMDIVTLAVGCEAYGLPIVRTQLRAFFDAASCQVHYEEASYSARLRRMTDPRTYPVIMEDSGYAQQMHEVHGE